MEITTQNLKIYKSKMIIHRKLKYNFLRETVNNLPSRSPLLEGVETEPFGNSMKV